MMNGCLRTKIFYFEFLCVANKKIDSSFSLSEEKSVVVLLCPQNKTKQEEEDAKKKEYYHIIYQ